MTKRDFFILLIKVFGLYSIVTVLFSTFPNILSLLTPQLKVTDFVWIVLAVLLNGLLVIGLLFVLLKKADWLSDFLQLEDGFDENRIDFVGLKSSDILKFAVLIIGGLLLINNIPIFLTHSIKAFQAAIPRGFDQAYDNQRIGNYSIFKDSRYLISGLNLLLGYLLIVNFKKVADYLNNKTTN